MPKMTVERGFFESHDEVLKDIAKTGFWPTTYVSDPSPELPLHYHKQDVIGYLMKGDTYVLGADGERVELSAGDKLILPKGAWHAEGEVTDQVVYIVTLPEPIPFFEALMPLEPKGPWPS